MHRDRNPRKRLAGLFFIALAEHDEVVTPQRVSCVFEPASRCARQHNEEQSLG